MSHSRWNLLPPVPEQRLINTSDFPPLITQILYNRGLIEPSQIESFITADDRLSGDPTLLSGMHQARFRCVLANMTNRNSNQPVKTIVDSKHHTDIITRDAVTASMAIPLAFPMVGLIKFVFI